MRSVIFDTETTDLLKAEANDISEQPYIIEIAVIVFEDDGKKFPVVDEYSALIKPPIAIPEKITQITKISEDDVKDKGPFIDIYHDLCTLFLGCNLVSCSFIFVYDTLSEVEVLKYNLSSTSLRLTLYFFTGFLLVFLQLPIYLICARLS